MFVPKMLAALRGSYFIVHFKVTLMICLSVKMISIIVSTIQLANENRYHKIK